jgi:hypothetical protein
VTRSSIIAALGEPGRPHRLRDLRHVPANTDCAAVATRRRFVFDAPRQVRYGRPAGET